MYGNGELDFLGSQSLSGTGTVDFEDNDVIANSFNPSGLKGLYVPTAGTTLTIASGVTIDGDTGFVGSTSGGFVTNDGTIAANGGGTITVQSDTNYSGGTLTGGTWQVDGSQHPGFGRRQHRHQCGQHPAQWSQRPVQSEYELQQGPGCLLDQRRRRHFHH